MSQIFSFILSFSFIIFTYLKVGVANGYLYALGGHDCPASNPSVCRTETVERYDPSTDNWTLVIKLFNYLNFLLNC